MNTIVTKKCSVCGKTKPIEEFYRNKAGLFGRRVDCKSCNAERRRTHRNNNQEHERARNQRYRLANLEREKAQKKEYRKKNKERISIANQIYYQAHKAIHALWNHKWYESHKEETAERVRNRKARIVGNGGKLSKEDWLWVLRKYGNACLRCGTTEDVTVDHVIPLILGGRNDKDNVQPLCGSCNSKKGKRIKDYRHDKQ